jgi:P4 family phage/plasmid primase-like protien
MKFQNATMKHVNVMNFHEFISKYSLNNTNHVTYTSLVTPKRRFSFKREHQNEFMNLYCEQIESDNKTLGITEIPIGKLPIIIDIDLKVASDNLKGRTKLYSIQNVLNFVNIVFDVLKKIAVNVDDNVLWCVLLEKPGYYNQQQTKFKNGFHLHFPNFIIERYVYHRILYPRILEALKKEDCFADIFNYDGLTQNYTYEEIFDPACFRNPWLLYGSRKEIGADAYQISSIIDSKLNIYTDEITINKYLQNVDTYWPDGKKVHFIKSISFYYPLILSIQATYKEPNPILQKLLYTIPVDTEHVNKNKINIEITRDVNQIKDNLEVARALLPLINNDRADIYGEWVQMGWLLFNISGGTEDGYKLWIEFSQRSDKFDEEQCEKIWTISHDKGMTIGSLCYYAQLDSPKEYIEWKKSRIIEKVNVKTEIFKYNSHHDIANILYDIYKSKYVCASISHKMWFEFDNHKWRRIEEGSSLRAKITKDIEDIMIVLQSNIQENINRLTSAQEKSQELEEAKQLVRKIRSNIKNSPFKNNVMREAAELFYDEDFLKKLDANPYLIGHKKGIYDLNNNISRDACPDDYMSMQMNIECKEFTENHPDVLEVHKFLEQIFPDYTVRKYIMDYYCDVFVGNNAHKYVMFWSGEGNNGKSVTEALFEKMLGDYAIKLPTSLLVGKRTQSSMACPELVRAGNGVRWALLQEPDQSDVLNVGILKELSGNDTFYARGLFKEGSEIKPMFKLILVCNEPPKIPYSDKATWNRIRVIPFESTFTNTAPDNYAEQLRTKTFKMDKKFDDKLKNMIEPFAWVLLNHRKKRIAKDVHDILSEPEKVMLATYQYRSRNDVYLQYVDDNIVDDPTSSLNITTIYNQFKDWFKEGYSYGSLPSKVDVKVTLSKLWGEPVGGVWKGKAFKIMEVPTEEIVL